MIRKHSSWVIFHISKPVRQLLKRFSLIAFLIIALALVLIIKSESPVLNSARSVVLDLFSPVFYLSQGVSDLTTGLFDGTSDYFFVYDKNQQLKLENEALKNKVVELQQAKQENLKLKSLLGFVKELSYEPKTARVVGYTGGVFINTIMINLGDSNGVKRGQAVVSEHGLVGRVIETFSNVSRVLLVTDINSKIPVITVKSRERSVLQGNGSSSPELLYLSENSSILDGERVITSGDGEVYPAGLKVGIVKKKADGLSEVNPFADWNKLEFVSVLQKQ